jgi:hypothetical protein
MEMSGKPLTKEKKKDLIYDADPYDDQFEVVDSGDLFAVSDVRSAVELLKNWEEIKRGIL